MHSGIERRGEDARRIPLDLWVRLSHEDYAEPFDADSVDLSRGGLALRSDYLPEIGDRLRCHFDAPDGDDVSLDGEVVWAHDAGGRSGQFGLRFTALDADLEARLARIVASLSPEAPRTGRVRLHLDGVVTPIEADVVKREDEWLTAEQSLPFLRLGMGVVVEGSFGPPRGRLAAVDVRVENGTPRLVLQVDLEQEAEEPDLAEIAARDREAHAIDARRHDARDDYDARDDHDAHADAFDPADARHDDLDGEDDELASAAEPDATLQDYVPPSVGTSRSRDDEVAVVRHAARGARAEARRDEGPEASVDLRAPAGADEEEGSLLAKARPYLLAARARAGALWLALREKSGPFFAAFLAKVAALFATLRAKGGPATERAWERTRAVALAVGGKVAQKARGKVRRRTTATPPTRVAESPKLRRQRAEREDEAKEEPPKRTGRRVVAIGALALVVGGAGVYAFSGDDEVTLPTEPAPVAAAPELAPPAPLPAPTVTAPAAIAPSEAPLALPAEALGTDPFAAPLAPEALPAPSREAGQLAAPTFPTLSEAQRRDAPVREGTSFGADSVENGRSATIRMSQPVTTLRGQEQEGGFTVTIPGSLALDRAGPLAAGNPSIERATILNRGDHAVLTVRFVAGRTPAYRVTAEGAAIQVTVGR